MQAGGKVLRQMRRVPGRTDWVDGNLRLLGEERPDLDLSGSEITARVFRLREIFVRRLDQVHAQFGLRPRMFLVLAALYRSGAPYKLSPASLMRHLMWTSGGLSQLLDRMEAGHLIRRRKAIKRGRGVEVGLLPEGRRIIAEILDVHCQTELQLIAPLEKGEQRSLVALLRKLLIAAEGPTLLALRPGSATAAGRSPRHA